MRKRASGPVAGPAVIASSLASQSLSRLSQRFFLCTKGVERRNPPAFLERFFREGAFKDAAASYLGSPRGGGGSRQVYTSQLKDFQGGGQAPSNMHSGPNKTHCWIKEDCTLIGELPFVCRPAVDDDPYCSPQDKDAFLLGAFF